VPTTGGVQGSDDAILFANFRMILAGMNRGSFHLHLAQNSCDQETRVMPPAAAFRRPLGPNPALSSKRWDENAGQQGEDIR
jgi:hypothetical protein